MKSAYQEKEIKVKNYFNHKNLIYPGFRLFLRALKKERRLEVWVKPSDSSKYVLLTTYDFCAVSGQLGPKRNEGDGQIPEGVYHINHFNPQSNFHLSLGINYPNSSDKLLGGVRPGSAIYIHGNCVTIGCIPITDDKIKELYILAVEARQGGQKSIPVHIFPGRLGETEMQELNRAHSSNPELIAFWKNLQPVYADFETNRKLKPVRVDSSGRYQF